MSAIRVIRNFLEESEADVIANYITYNTLNATNLDYITGVVPGLLGAAFASRLGEGWKAVGDARFTVRWDGVVDLHRDWYEPGILYVLLIYLTDVYNGGATVFHTDNGVIRVKPEKCKAVLFDGFIPHESEDPMNKKVILTCDVKYEMLGGIDDAMYGLRI